MSASIPISTAPPILYALITFLYLLFLTITIIILYIIFLSLMLAIALSRLAIFHNTPYFYIPNPFITTHQSLQYVLEDNCPATIGKKYEGKCVICLEKVGEKVWVRQLRCLHWFCKECIDLWVVKGGWKCPLCARSIFTEEGICDGGTW
eukprot:Plantae.Rhodophyta-Hildenbrandia_rubra.ctg1390.p1 GENE.Plantae.Rhodophyta-Hildenbrandia_rubra.ctg1390~~Plantae.Rhodophyta-Hildenbrandia_rubra.ctg1390.p1  ORF type:complete len:149 (-),score=4.07 Plantae.Rhodophyta-Hildenbrandia_rubra.ctg1390:445-891(-)